MLCMFYIFSCIYFRCQHCGAIHWIEERLGHSSKTSPKFRCCQSGKINVPKVNDTPEALRHLLSETRVNRNGKIEWAERTAHFHQNIRVYNNALSFTSLGVKIDESITNNNNGAYSFRIQGELYHRLGSLLPPDDQEPRFAQIWMSDGTEEMTLIRERIHPQLRRDILTLLNNLMLQHNPYATFFRTAQERIANDPASRVRLCMVDTNAHDPRRYNRPTANEIAAIIVGDELSEREACRDIIVEHQARGFQRVSELHPSYFPMRFPLIFLFGEQGWHPYIPLSRADLQANPNLSARRRNHLAADFDQLDDNDDDGGDQRGRGGSTRVSQAEFFAYHFQDRNEFSPLLYGGRLYQEVCVDAWVTVESNRLNFMRANQKQLRSDLYSGLQDAVGGGLEENPQRLGKQIILSSTFAGSPRHMRQQYQDAMSICRHCGKPDLFITFTCNPNWPEILEALESGQTPSDRPDIVARVFNEKLKALLDDLIKHKIFGDTLAHVYTIEFQKRGLPHAHILLILQPDCKIRDVEEIDKIISAEIPDPAVDPELHRVVTSFMIHGPCGAQNLRAPCMKDGKCSKKYPKMFSEETIWSDDGYPIYRRSNNGRTFVSPNGVEVDNRWVVPYNPYLSKRYNAHINVEICSSILAFKYLYKYVYKGSDRATVVLENANNNAEGVNEIKEYVDARCVTPPEAMWRIFQNKMHGRSHSITRLQVLARDSLLMTGSFTRSTNHNLSR